MTDFILCCAKKNVGKSIINYFIQQEAATTIDFYWIKFLLNRILKDEITLDEISIYNNKLWC